MFKVIALAFLVATSMATFSIDLEQQTIDDAQYVYYNTQQGNPARTVAVSAASPVIADGDRVYTYTAKIGDKEERVLFDTTVGNNWEYVESQNPLIKGSYTVAAGQSRAVLSAAEQSTVEKIQFGQNELTNVSVDRSNQPAANANKSLFKAANYGLALNRQYQQNFFHSLQKSNVKLEEKGKGFSFYFSDKVNQLFFGKPQTFFAKQSLETIDAKTQENNSEWVIPVKKQGVSLKGLDALSYTDPSYATFDTTTRYIWAANNLVDSIVSKLNSNQLNCQDLNQTHATGLYECSEGEFPELQFQFQTMDATDAEDTRIYSLTNYVEKLGNGKVRLLIRKSGLYQNTTNGAVRVPSTTVNSKSNNFIILGTVFLENVYTYFSYDDHTVSLAQAYNLQPQGKDMSYTWRLWFLILGTLGMIAALAAILALLKKVPYNPSAQPTLPPVAPAPVAQTVSYVPQQITQSYVKTSQPVYYVQRASSPQRVVQSLAPQQQYYVQ